MKRQKKTVSKASAGLCVQRTQRKIVERLIIFSFPYNLDEKEKKTKAKPARIHPEKSVRCCFEMILFNLVCCGCVCACLCVCISICGLCFCRLFIIIMEYIPLLFL